jgi:hypothetical protein
MELQDLLEELNEFVEELQKKALTCEAMRDQRNISVTDFARLIAKSSTYKNIATVLAEKLERYKPSTAE